MKKLKLLITPTLVIFIVIALILRNCVTVNDIVGLPIRSNKEGRELWVQYLDGIMKPSIEVKSDYYDYNLLERLWVLPKRTTIYFKTTEQHQTWDANHIEGLMSIPLQELLSIQMREFPISADETITIDEFLEIVKTHNILKLENMLEGMGFEKVVFINSDGSTVVKELHGERMKIIGL